METWVIILISLFTGAFIAWFFVRYITERLDAVTNQLDKRLHENARAMRDSQGFVTDRMQNTEKAVREISRGLGQLEQVTAALKTSTDDINSFQELLKSPKVRGSFGEVLLGNLLSEVLPGDRYELQYTLPHSTEIADAIIKLQDGYIVAVDAKFPLANYQKEDATKQLIRDIKKHVKDISRKYISPANKTLDYAFMYIPVEGVYYETMVQNADGDSLWDFCLEQHVVPVSPNSFLAYLHTVLVGLRGMKVEQQAKEIITHLSQIRRDFINFSEDFATVGTHLSNAKNRYDDSLRRLDKFSNRLEQIEDTSGPALAE